MYESSNEVICNRLVLISAECILIEPIFRVTLLVNIRPPLLTRVVDLDVFVWLHCIAVLF